MPTCELVTIGSELLNGCVLNTNAQFLAKRISALDIDVVRQASCRDQEKDILEALSDAFGRSDLIVVTGGLGPTPDDITRQAVAKFLGCGLKFDSAQYRHIVRYFKTLKRSVPFITRREAYLPELAQPLLNRFGIAVGFYARSNQKLLVVLPGVPRELVHMYETRVDRLIKRVFRNRPRIYQLEARIASLYETQIMRRLGSRFFKGRIFDFGIYPEIGDVTIRIKTQERRLVSVLRKELQKKVGRFLYNFEGESLPHVIGREFVKQQKTLSIAESCTGGLLAKRMTDPPGASRYFKGGIVAYSNQIKFRGLGLPRAFLMKYGAVSKEAAAAMARAVRNQYETSIGVAVTGIAGPGGGTSLKPVGLVYLGISDSRKTKAFQFRFLGERDKVRIQATQKALFILWQWLAKR